MPYYFVITYIDLKGNVCKDKCSMYEVVEVTQHLREIGCIITNEEKVFN